jgi:sugar (pentulose or hexulose) kinase
VAQSGAGANQEGKVHICIGTATWVGISTSTFHNDPEKPFWGLSHIDPKKYIIAGEMTLHNASWQAAMDYLARLEVTEKAALIDSGGGPGGWSVRCHHPAGSGYRTNFGIAKTGYRGAGSGGAVGRFRA